MRSFLTRFPNSRIGVVLPIPCLLICLACATPFAQWRLEEGMTQDEVRAAVGEPKSMLGPDISPRKDLADEVWEYGGFWSTIDLYFVDAKLIYWRARDTGGGYSDPGLFNQQWGPSIDAEHHSKGHTHHHGHC